MGHALQYVNIARDVRVDAAIGRVYLPTTWLAEVGITPDAILAQEAGPSRGVAKAVGQARERLLNLAFAKYREARPAMELLPRELKGPMVVAVESYMEIGRVLREEKERARVDVGAGGARRATVPKTRRMWVAWRSLLWQ